MAVDPGGIEGPKPYIGGAEALGHGLDPPRHGNRIHLGPVGADLPIHDVRQRQAGHGVEGGVVESGILGRDIVVSFSDPLDEGSDPLVDLYELAMGGGGIPHREGI